MAAPAVPLSKVRRAGAMVYLSGELPFGEDGSIPDGIAAQTDLTLQRIAATLEGEGLRLADIVSCTVYLRDPADFAAFNQVYRAHFDEPYPVRTTVAAVLMVDALIEISVIAGPAE